MLFRSDKGTASKYGTPYFFFPIDNYKYIYSNEIEDLYDHFGLFSDFEPISLKKNIIASVKKDWMLKQSFETRYLINKNESLPTEENLNKFIKDEMDKQKERIIKEVDKIMKTYKTSNFKNAKQETEIVFKCDEYYMVDMKLRNYMRSIVKI